MRQLIPSFEIQLPKLSFLHRSPLSDVKLPKLSVRHVVPSLEFILPNESFRQVVFVLLSLTFPKESSLSNPLVSPHRYRMFPKASSLKVQLAEVSKGETTNASMMKINSFILISPEYFSMAGIALPVRVVFRHAASTGHNPAFLQVGFQFRRI